MNNNTKVRIHLSKQLFESLSREVLAEAKSGKKNWGAGMEEVKTKKAPKSPEMKATNKMKTMEEMSSKEKMAKGLYKEANPEKAKMKKMEEVKKKVMEIAKKHLAGKAVKESTLKEGQSIIIKNAFTLDGKLFKAGDRVDSQPDFDKIEAAAKKGDIKATDFKYAVGGHL